MYIKIKVRTIINILIAISIFVLITIVYNVFIVLGNNIWASEYPSTDAEKGEQLGVVCDILKDNSIRYRVEDRDCVTWIEGNYYYSTEKIVYISYFDTKRASKILSDANLDFPGFTNYHSQG